MEEVTNQLSLHDNDIKVVGPKTNEQITVTKLDMKKLKKYDNEND
jgi:hypothetical protein